MEYHGMGTRSWASMLTVKAFTELLARNHEEEAEPFFLSYDNFWCMTV